MKAFGKHGLRVAAAALLVSAAVCVGAQDFALTSKERVVTGKLLLSVDGLRPGDEFELAFVANVRSGYHIGAADPESLYPARLTVDAPDVVVLEPPRYPPARRLKGADGKYAPAYEGKFVVRVHGRLKKSARPGFLTFTARFESQGCKGDQCTQPEMLVSALQARVVPPGTAVGRINSDVFESEKAVSTQSPGEQDLADRLAGRGLAARLVMLFALGLMLAFTPCVYPMIPVTVGYFSAQEERRTRRVLWMAAAYVLGLALTYSFLGAAAAATGSAFGEWMQHPAVLLGIALVLIGLAASMFGLYEIRPPSFIQDRASGRSGIAGALVMGLIFGVVAAPCVGPVAIGLLLYVARLGSPLMGFLLFFAMALGIGTPLFFLAAFSARLPVPGVWMVAVRKLAGFLLIGAAAYFAGPVVPKEIRTYLIPAVVAAAGVYFALFERSIRSHRVSAAAAKALGLIAVITAIILAAPNAKATRLIWQPYTEHGLARAALERRPAMVDFTADWCPACKELEHTTFTDPTVIKAAERFRLFRVDATDGRDPAVRAAVKKHGVMGFPTVLFFDSSGREVRSVRLVGFADPADLLRRMDKVR